MLALHLLSCNSDGLMLMADDLSGLISELSFGILGVSRPTLPEIRHPPLGTPTNAHTHEKLMHRKKKTPVPPQNHS